MLCSDLIHLQWRKGKGWTRPANAILEEISPASACVHSEVPVPANSVVRIRRGDKTIEGTVVNCAFDSIGYFAEIEFNAGFEWSPELFRPEHLFDPQTLAEKPRTRTAGT
jgi:hypothetical protein